jgi:hypothetical protein
MQNANCQKILIRFQTIVVVAALVVGCGESPHMRSGLYEDIQIVRSMLNRFEQHEGRRPDSRKELLSFFDGGLGSGIDFEYVAVGANDYIFVWKGDMVLLETKGDIFRLHDDDVKGAVKKLESGAEIKNLELSKL